RERAFHRPPDLLQERAQRMVGRGAHAVEIQIVEPRTKALDLVLQDRSGHPRFLPMAGCSATLLMRTPFLRTRSGRCCSPGGAGIINAFRSERALLVKEMAYMMRFARPPPSRPPAEGLRHTRVIRGRAWSSPRKADWVGRWSPRARGGGLALLEWQEPFLLQATSRGHCCRAPH